MATGLAGFETRRRLVAVVLRERFGPHVQVVGSALHTQGPQGLNQLARATGLKLKRVQECVFVLLHHALVDVRIWPSRPDVHEYRLLEENVLWRLFSPRYLVFAEQGHGPEAAALITQLMLHRTLREATLFERVRQQRPASSRDSIEATLRRLRESHFIVPLTRFQLTTPEEDTDKPRKKKKAAVAVEMAVPVHCEYGMDYVTFNRRRFDLQICCDIVVNMVRDKLSSRAARIVAIMIDYSMPEMALGSSGAPLPAYTRPVVYRDVVAAVRNQPELLQDLDSYMTLLEHDPNHFIERRTDGSYVVPLINLIKTKHRQMLEAFIAERFGAVGQRIFRLLLEKQQLEQREITRAVAANWNEIRSTLYQMLAAGCVHLQEIPKTPDRTAARTFYLWHVDLPSCTCMLMSTVQKTIVNMRERVIFERESQKLLIERMELARAHLPKDPGTSVEEIDPEMFAAVLNAQDLHSYRKLHHALRLFGVAHERAVDQLHTLWLLKS